MTILNEYSVINGALFFLAIILIFFATLSITCFYTAIRERTSIASVITFFIISVLLLLGSSALTIYTFKNPICYVECTIDENYSVQELIDRYEIVSTKGKIVKLMEKKNGN